MLGHFCPNMAKWELSWKIEFRQVLVIWPLASRKKPEKFDEFFLRKIENRQMDRQAKRRRKNHMTQLKWYKILVSRHVKRIKKIKTISNYFPEILCIFYFLKILGMVRYASLEPTKIARLIYIFHMWFSITVHKNFKTITQSNLELLLRYGYSGTLWAYPGMPYHM